MNKNFFKLNQLEVSCLPNNNNNAIDYVHKFYLDIKKVEPNTIELNESNSKNFAHIKEKFRQIDANMNKMVVNIQNAFVANNGETITIMDNKWAQNFNELIVFTDQSFKSIEEKFFEINTSMGNLNNKWLEMSNELKSIQNKINNYELGYNMMNIEVDNLKKNYGELKIVDINQGVNRIDVDKKIKDCIEQYDGVMVQKIVKNNVVIKNYMDNINNSLSNK